MSSSSIDLESDTTALLDRGHAHVATGFYEDALPFFRKWREHSSSGRLSYHQEAGSCLFGEGFAFYRLRDYEKALSAFGEISQYTGNDPRLRRTAACGLVAKGFVLRDLHCNEEALAVFHEMLSRYGGLRDDPIMRRPLALGLIGQAQILLETDCLQKALTAFEEVLPRRVDLSTIDDPLLRLLFARAIIGRGTALNALGRDVDALAAFDEALLISSGDENYPPLSWPIVNSLVGKGQMLCKLGFTDRALATFDKVISHLGTTTPAPLIGRFIAIALNAKGRTLSALGSYKEALESFDKTFHIFGSEDKPILYGPVASAFYHKAVTLAEIGRYEEALENFEEVVRRFGSSSKSTSVWLRYAVTAATIWKANLLVTTGRYENALAVCDDVSKTIGFTHNPMLRQMNANALLLKAQTLGTIGRCDEALGIFEDLAQCPVAGPSSSAANSFVVEHVSLIDYTPGLLGIDEDDRPARDDTASRYDRIIRYYFIEPIEQSRYFQALDFHGTDPEHLYNARVGGKITTPSRERGSPKTRQRLPPPGAGHEPARLPGGAPADVTALQRQPYARSVIEAWRRYPNALNRAADEILLRGGEAQLISPAASTIATEAEAREADRATTSSKAGQTEPSDELVERLRRGKRPNKQWHFTEEELTDPDKVKKSSSILNSTAGIPAAELSREERDARAWADAFKRRRSELLSRVYPEKAVRKALDDLAANAARETPGRAKAEPRPEIAATTTNATTPALAWPSKKWKDAAEKILGKKRGIVTFLEREWEPFIQKSGQVVTRDILAMHDSDAEQALTRHLETHDFPEGISIIYPKRLMNLASERPDLVRAALGVRRGSDLRK